MTSITGATTPSRFDAVTPQPLPGHGSDAPAAPATPKVPRDWHATATGIGLGGAGVAIAALTLGMTGRANGTAMAAATGVGIGVAAAGGLYGVLGPKPSPSPGTVTPEEVLRPIAGPLLGVGILGTVVGLSGWFNVTDDPSGVWASGFKEWPTVGKTALISVAVGGALVGVAALIDSARRN